MDPSLLNQKRSISVTTPLPLNTLVFESMSGEEMLGRPFTFEVDLLSDSSEIDLRDLLGKPMTIHVDVPSGQRHFNGIVTEFRVVGAVRRFTRYRASLRSELSLLAYTSDCRIFQKMTVPEIVQRVFKTRHVTYSDQGLKGTYRPLEYVVQYRESDLNFVSRLLEQEGIFYYFQHEDGKHKLVLADEVSSCKAAPGYEAVPYLPPDEKHHKRPEHISQWTAGARLVPGQFTVRDFTYKPVDRPTAAANTILKGGDQSPRAGADYEVYDFPGDARTAEEARHEAVTRLREHESWFQTAEALADVRGLGAGHTFKVVNLPRLIQSEKNYLVVKASYSLQTASYEGNGDTTQEEYRVAFTLIDATCEYRTPRETPRPRVQGPQTATVVRRKNDPKDEEICTDDDGRVMVKFHWDRRGEPASPADDPLDADKEQSMFIRVSQGWAGPGWGASFIPRVGHEVIVDFLEGDPDKPIITGRVYNGDNKPPYPKTPTQSGIKTRSTKGAGPNNFNEIRFEDKKGSEELFMQAEKNKTVNVKNNRGATVGANDSVSVGGDRAVSVTGNLSVTVNGKGAGEIHSLHTVTGKYNLHASDTIEEDAPNHILLTCGGSSIKIEPNRITLTAGGKAVLVLDENVLAQSNDLSKMVLDANAFMQASKGAAVLLDANVLAQSKAVSQLVLDGNATLTSRADVKVGGVNVEVSGKEKVAANGGGAQLELAAAGATLSGSTVGVSGKSMTEITGAIVKIN